MWRSWHKGVNLSMCHNILLSIIDFMFEYMQAVLPGQTS